MIIRLKYIHNKESIPFYLISKFIKNINKVFNSYEIPTSIPEECVTIHTKPVRISMPTSQIQSRKMIQLVQASVTTMADRYDFEITEMLLTDSEIEVCESDVNEKLLKQMETNKND